MRSSSWLAPPGFGSCIPRPRRRTAKGRCARPRTGPFLSAALITPMILGVALAPVALTAGRVVVAVFLAATIALGGWLTGQWIASNLDQDSAHLGYYLPSVAGGP